MNALQNGLLSGSLTSELLSAHADRALALAFHKPVGIYNREGRRDAGILPATAKSHADTDNGIRAVTKGRSIGELGREELALGVEHSEVVGIAVGPPESSWNRRYPSSPSAW